MKKASLWGLLGSILWLFSVLFEESISIYDGFQKGWLSYQPLSFYIFQLIDLMKVEGHFLLWYLCIMPFAKINLAYPYPMLLLNWIFAISSLFIMWYKAPFSRILKTCITFSAPFISLYAIQARCYSIGILFLFLAMTIYKKRTDRPYLYLTYLTLAANTSFPACVAAGILGLIFIFDLIKIKANKKFFFIISATVILNLILFYFQFHGAAVPDYEKMNASLNLFVINQILNNIISLYKAILLLIGFVLFLWFLFKSKRAFIFFTSSTLINTLFFTFVYHARIHHYCMIFIFAIIAYWIYKLECKNTWKIDWFNILFITIILEFVFMYITIPTGHVELAYFILKDQALQDAKIYTNIAPIALAPSIPYLENKHIYLYDLAGRNLSSYEGLKTYFNEKDKKYDTDILAQSLDLKKDTYLIIFIPIDNNYINGKKYQIKIKKYATIILRELNTTLYVYKVLNITNNPSGEEFIFPQMYQKNSNIQKDIQNNYITPNDNNKKHYNIDSKQIYQEISKIIY